jgi:predicted ribosomally synthesized peptide with nif11-like leader
MTCGLSDVRPIFDKQLSSLLAKLNDDAGLQVKYKGATDLEAGVELAKEAGLDVTKVDWLSRQASQTLESSDEQLVGWLAARQSLYN